MADDGRMEKKRRAKDCRRIVEEFERSGSTRRQFCERNNMPVTTLDYWRLRLRKARKAGLVEVAIEADEPAEKQTAARFSVVLSNGRRIESSWGFREADLSTLIRVVERA